MKLPRIYLAGAIRPDHPEDREWRVKFAQGLIGLAIVYDPMYGKELQPDGTWTVFGIPTHDRMIVQQDFFMVDNSDIIVFNLLAMKDGYHCIGTMTEFGRSTGRTVMRYVVAPPDDTSPSYPKVHPFIVQNSAHIFTDLDAALKYIQNVCGMLTVAERLIPPPVMRVMQQPPQGQQQNRIVVPHMEVRQEVRQK